MLRKSILSVMLVFLVSTSVQSHSYYYNGYNRYDLPSNTYSSSGIKLHDHDEHGYEKRSAMLYESGRRRDFIKPASNVLEHDDDDDETSVENDDARARIVELQEELHTLHEQQRLHALEELRDRLFAAHEHRAGMEHTKPQPVIKSDFQQLDRQKQRASEIEEKHTWRPWENMHTRKAIHKSSPSQSSRKQPFSEDIEEDADSYDDMKSSSQHSELINENKAKNIESIFEKSSEWIRNSPEETLDEEHRKSTMINEELKSNEILPIPHDKPIDANAINKNRETDSPKFTELLEKFTPFSTTATTPESSSEPSSKPIVVRAVNANIAQVNVQPSEKIVFNVFKDADGNLKVEVSSEKKPKQEDKTENEITDKMNQDKTNDKELASMQKEEIYDQPEEKTILVAKNIDSQPQGLQLKRQLSKYHASRNKGPTGRRLRPHISPFLNHQNHAYHFQSTFPNHKQFAHYSSLPVEHRVKTLHPHQSKNTHLSSSEQSNPKQSDNLHFDQEETSQHKLAENIHSQLSEYVHSKPLYPHQASHMNPPNFFRPDYPLNHQFDKNDLHYQLLEPFLENRDYKKNNYVKEPKLDKKIETEEENEHNKVMHKYKIRYPPSQIPEEDVVKIFSKIEKYGQKNHHQNVLPIEKTNARVTEWPVIEKVASKNVTLSEKENFAVKLQSQSNKDLPKKASDNYYFEEYKQEEHGCEELSCPAYQCQIGVYKYNLESGCSTCDCCQALDCFEYCEHGYEADEYGCPICECASPIDEHDRYW